MSTTVCHAAMSNSRVRKETRFLTDKMAYELNLNTAQYNDVYEINYDFISGVRYLMDDVLRGEEWALNRYYDYLDVRNVLNQHSPRRQAQDAAVENSQPMLRKRLQEPELFGGEGYAVPRAQHAQ